MMTERNLATAFQQLDTVLTNTQDLWRPQPFTSSKLDWQLTHPRLSNALLALDENQARDLHDNQQRRIAWFRELEPALCETLYAFEPSATVATHQLALNRFDNIGISGRKWEQIIAFASALPQHKLPLVDWCAGKGHLSRMVQRDQQQTVHCLEWDANLVTAGSALAEKHQLNIHYHQHDVMQPPPAPCGDPANIHIGLHACGELHSQLLRHVAHSGAQAVALSPCCYHKIPDTEYQPLSAAAKQSRLVLNRPALHLAVQDTVTARRGERQLRERERLWRLSFDALQRDVRGCDEYL
ncbi:MAG: methyltransferase, partial [Alcanivorax sp.]|nr:methyltransferase [Alcanivorax sp.]